MAVGNSYSVYSLPIPLYAFFTPTLQIQSKHSPLTRPLRQPSPITVLCESNGVVHEHQPQAQYLEISPLWTRTFEPKHGTLSRLVGLVQGEYIGDQYFGVDSEQVGFTSFLVMKELHA